MAPVADRHDVWGRVCVPAGRWPWKSESAKECVTIHLPKQLALKMDGAEASRLYSAVSGNWGGTCHPLHEALTSRRVAAVCAEGSWA